MTVARIAERFVANAERHPDNIALYSQSLRWTYRQLADHANGISQALVASAANTPRIAIVAERCPQFVAAMIGVSQTDAAFVVLDSGYPDERLRQLLETCGAGFIISAGGDALRDRVAALSAALRLPTLDTARVEPCPTDQRPVPSPVSSSQPAYLLFTSGSTGTPKCVAVSHEPLVHFVDWHVAEGGLAIDDRFSLISGLSHDPVLRDVFTPLSVGATLFIPEQKSIVEPGGLRRWLGENRISVSHLTPSLGRMILADKKDAPGLPSLRRLYWGGEPLTCDLVREMAAIAPSAAQTNFYGSTETPQAICYHPIDMQRMRDPLPIGQPVPGFSLSIIDGEGRDLPDGQPGEVLVSSPYLSLGCVTNGNLVRTEPQDRYRTGDVGHKNPDGTVFLQGRRDDQVKVRGYRVSLSEISQQISRLPGVRFATTLLIEGQGPARIESFVDLAKFDAALPVSEIVARLRARLPGYMVPSRVHLLDGAPPLLPNGKLDRQALIAIATARPVPEPQLVDDGASTRERALVEAWRALFAGQNVSANSSFRSLCGDSLTFVQAYLAAEEILGSLPEDWTETSIGVLAAENASASAHWVSVDSTIAIRAFAIVSIVAYHFCGFWIGSGLTGALFLVSGFLFSSLKLPDKISSFGETESWRSISRIFLPACVFSLLTYAIDFVLHKPLPIPTLLFYADLVDYPALDARGAAYFRHDIVFWYVDCLLQMLAGITLLCMALKRTRLKDGPSIWVPAILLAVGLIGRFLLPSLVAPHLMRESIPELSLYQLAPFSNIATFALGMMAFFAIRRSVKRNFMALVLLYSALDAFYYGLGNGLGVLAASALLNYCPRITIPRALSPVLREVSSASLFIYMAQFLLAFIIDKILHRQSSVAESVAAVAGGIAISKAWMLANAKLALVRPTPQRVLGQ